jgi:spore coat protein U-like protein
MKKILLTPFALAFGLFISGQAQASEATTTLEVSVTVGVFCSAYTDPIEFGQYSGEQAIQASGGISVNCPSGTLYHIALDGGLNGAGSYRRATNGLDNIPYNLYNWIWEPWGDDGATHDAPMGFGYGTGNWDFVPVYAEMWDPGFTPSDGVYTDTVGVTVYY